MAIKHIIDIYIREGYKALFRGAEFTLRGIISGLQIVAFKARYPKKKRPDNDKPNLISVKPSILKGDQEFMGHNLTKGMQYSNIILKTGLLAPSPGLTHLNDIFQECLNYKES